MTEKFLIDESNLDESKTFTTASSGEVTPVHILGLAKGILLVVALMYIGAAIAEYLKPGNHIYEACKITLPSIATLVIGYYFGTAKS